jgi:phosphatidylglycerophosphate synthase
MVQLVYTSGARVQVIPNFHFLIIIHVPCFYLLLYILMHFYQTGALFTSIRIFDILQGKDTQR